MPRTPLPVLLLLFLAAACGSVRDRAQCSTSAACPAGEYCAHTADGSVCWPDAVPPTIGTVTAGCGTSPCLRDGALPVSVGVADDREVFAVEAWADVDPVHRYALHPSGTAWSGTIPFGELPFPALERAVIVTVRALDGARNEVTATAGATVTRVRWVYNAGASLTAPAVMANGTVVVGRNALADQLVGVNPDGTNAWTLTVGSGTVTAPPSVGMQAIWVGGSDGRLYGVKLDGSGELSPSRSCTASGVAKGPPAILTTSGVDVAFGAFTNGRIYASGPTCVPTAALAPPEPFSSGGAVGSAGAVYAPSSTASAKTLRRFTWDGAAFSAGWSASLGDTTTAPLAMDALERVLSASVGGQVERSASGVSSLVGTLNSAIDDSPIVLANGDIVVGDASGKLHRLDSTGAAMAGWPVDLGAPVHAPMALAGGPIRVLVATSDGKVHALDDAGGRLWSGALHAGFALGAGNLSAPAGNPPFSTAYFAGADGKLYAVIVEGGLDTAAPWPKAWHDSRNTSRAGAAF